MVEVFSIPAFFIVLREVLEACLVVGIVLAYLNKTGATQYKKWVWWGAGSGILISAAFGIAFAVVFYVRGDQLFQGNAEKIFEGVTFLLAAGLLTWMIIWMMVMGKSLRANMEKQIDAIVDNDDKSPFRRKASIFFMVFVQVLREGIETVVFLIGTVDNDSVSGWRAIPIPGILAIIVGLCISFFVFKGLLDLDIQMFFLVSGFILMAFAAGLVSHAFHELQESDWFGAWDPEGGKIDRDWYNFSFWSTKPCCDDKKNEFFAMLRALFGYQDTPTFIEWATYFGYWLIVVGIFVGIHWSILRAARSSMKSQAQRFTSVSLLFTFVAFIYTLVNVTWIGTTTMTIAFILSIITTFLIFEPTMRLIKPLMGMRGKLVLFTGVAWAAHTFFMFVLHLVQMECIGDKGDECGIDKFFFFGLIFNGPFNERGREITESGSPEAFPAIASLSFSIVLTVFFFGLLSFFLIMASMNITADGEYLTDDAVKVADDVEVSDGSDEVPVMQTGIEV